MVRADGRVEILEGDGLPLGLFADAQPEPARPGAVTGRRAVLLHRRGDRGAQRGRCTFFEDRLADALAAVDGSPAAAQIVRAVQELVTTFSRGELRDDVTIVAVKVEGAG